MAEAYVVDSAVFVRWFLPQVGWERAIDDLGVTVHSTDVDALERAAQLSASRMVSVYDASFVELALQRDLPLLTSDAKLVRAVAGLLSTELLAGIQP